MDTVTISAIVFVLIMAGSGMATRSKLGIKTIIALIVLEVGNLFQFGYFSDLWPFTAMGIFYVAAFVVLGVAAGVMAYQDAKDAE